VEEVFGKKPRNTSKNAEIIWKSLENHGNILKQLLKTYGHIYETTWEKTEKKVPALFIWIDTDSQWIAKHGISGFDQHHEDF
jgi:deoxyadenosine/deoxycytidine kinase